MEAKNYYPLTKSQIGLLLGEIVTLNPCMMRQTNMLTFYLIAPDNKHPEELKVAYNKVRQLNDALRLVVERHHGKYRQYIRDYQPQEVGTVYCEDDELEERVREAQKVLMPIVAEEHLWAQVIVTPTRACIVIRANHMCLDGYSMSLMIKQMQGYYQAAVRGEPDPVFRVGSFEDAIRYEQDYLKSDSHKQDHAFWFHTFAHQRHYRNPGGRRSLMGYSQQVAEPVNDEQYKRILAYAADAGISTTYLMMALTALTVYRMTGAQRFCLSTLSHGRRTFKLKQTVGCMMNLVPVIFALEQDDSIADFIKKQYALYLDCLDHGQMPMGEMIPLTYWQAVKCGLDFEHYSWLLFSSMDFAVTATDGFQSGSINLPVIPYKFYLSMFEKKEQELFFHLNYQTAVCKQKTVDAITKNFREVVSAFTEDPQRIIKTIRG